MLNKIEKNLFVDDSVESDPQYIKFSELVKKWEKNQITYEELEKQVKLNCPDVIGNK